MHNLYIKAVKNLVGGSFFACLTIFQGNLVIGQSIQEDNHKQLVSLIDQLSKDNQKISENIISEDFSSAQSNSDDLLYKLRGLIEIFIPLQDRLKSLISEEQKIQNGNNFLGKETHPLSDYSQGLLSDLVKKQNVNQEKTLLAASIIANQISALEENKQPQGNPEKGKKKNLLIKVRELVAKAGVIEAGVISTLQTKDFTRAEGEITHSINLLKEALEMFQKKGGQQNSQNQQDEKQQSKNQNQEKQKQEAKNQNDKPRNDKSEGEKEEGKQQKMSPEDALRKLAEIQKRDRDELKKREKRFGKLKTPGQIPVEKDW
ncbi:MAG: hypothetical protein GY786_16150 [Proteobacteria bacterium]|nr:hypothetical protein [Pseudomonadota bacterium]